MSRPPGGGLGVAALRGERGQGNAKTWSGERRGSPDFTASHAVQVAATGAFVVSEGQGGFLASASIHLGNGVL